MANPELIEYAKNQLKAGSSPNYVRTVLMKQGWGERDVDDALGIAQAEAGPAKEVQPGPGKPDKGPKTKTRRVKFLPVAGILTGALFIISALFSILNEIVVIALTFNISSWITAIIQIVAGIFWIIYGIKEFT